MTFIWTRQQRRLVHLLPFRVRHLVLGAARRTRTGLDFSQGRYTELGVRCAGYPISTVGPGSSRRCLRPGGFAYLAEFHPFADILDDRKGRTVTLDYFAEGPRSGMSRTRGRTGDLGSPGDVGCLMITSGSGTSPATAKRPK